MKTKLYVLTIAILGIMGWGNAQAPNPECATNLSIYSEHVKVKNYDAAYEPWKMVYDNCPDINRANFTYGERILKDKIKKTAGAEKEGYIKDLMSLHDKSIEYFPKRFTKAGVIIDKVDLMYTNKMIKDQESYDELHKAFTEDRANFKNSKALYLYFSSLVNLHKAGSKNLQSVFDTYDDVGEKIEEENIRLTNVVNKLLPKEDAGTLTAKEKRQLKAATQNSENYGKISGSIDSKLGDLANCENLIPLYEKSFDEKKTDVTWVKRAVGRMYGKECTDQPLFVKLVEAQVAIEPSADSYFYLGLLKQKKGDTKGAVADFNKAIDLETDNVRKSNILYKVASIYRRGSKSTARSYARKAIKANPSSGKSYLLIARLIGASANDCGSTSFEKRAIYWKAANTANKAARVDPSVKSRASKLAANFNAKAPTKTDIFNSGKAGQSVSFNCWVGGSVTVPAL